MTASEYTSLAGVSVLPWACSGLMNSGVPKTMPSCVRITEPGRIWPLADLGEAEIEDLRKIADRPRLDQKDVLGLEVAVNDPGSVRLVERAAHLDEDGESPGHREGPLVAHRLIQVPALQELHDDVERTVFELSVEEHFDGVRVRQMAHRSSFAPEARDEIFAIGELRVEDFHPHHAVHLRLERLVDGAHPARPDLLKDLELAVQDVASDERILRAHGLTQAKWYHESARGIIQPRRMALRSRRLTDEGFRHGFSTRQDTDAAYVAIFTPDVLALGKQVHGANVVEATDAAGAEADAVVARARASGSGEPSGLAGLSAGVRTADCVPILLADLTTGDVAAVHAGWRGVVAGVVPAAVGAFGEGARLVAAVGPCIGGCCFEVGREVAEAIAAAAEGARVVVREAKDKAYVDLRTAVRAQLVAHGVASNDIEEVAGCTQHEADRFHSFRRDGAASGRMTSAIGPRR